MHASQIDKVPTCDCPDGLKGNKCKHQLFVLLKILQIPQSSNLWYQAAFLQDELTAIFANARPAPRTAFEEGIVKRYQVVTGKLEPDEVDTAEAGLVKKRVPEEGDSCPICCASSSLSDARCHLVSTSFPLTRRRTQTRTTHLARNRGSSSASASRAAATLCTQSASATGQRRASRRAYSFPPALLRVKRNDLCPSSARSTCPLCRQKWTDTSSATSGGAQAGPSYSTEGYTNFAASTGISTKRDTSSCESSRTLSCSAGVSARLTRGSALSRALADYQGPRRGAHGGWRFGYGDDEYESYGYGYRGYM